MWPLSAADPQVRLARFFVPRRACAQLYSSAKRFRAKKFAVIA